MNPYTIVFIVNHPTGCSATVANKTAFKMGLFKYDMLVVPRHCDAWFRIETKSRQDTGAEHDYQTM